ncbi:peptidoglycan-binding domain-containing protein [Neolewinella litorea]|uniref:Uncharacterized protein n=1 Tax=Neolewinella litorea TaxID=2562452 RepID=A0A4S4NMS6_9BACT|nr:hypothetical protein [Neolewinella litorea]THH41249.1 hypothetical protein E4021_01230 [Neolewinella litorea]
MNTGAFITTCRRLGAGERDPEVADQAFLAVADTMTVRYAIPFPATVQRTFDRRDTPSRTRRGQWHEMVQHLTDLNYLSIDTFQLWHQARAGNQEPPPKILLSVVEAVGRFVAEDDYPGYALIPSFPRGHLSGRLDWVEEYIVTVVYRLALYTSFDGDTEVRPRYRIGEQTAYGRSLAFRLRVYFHHYRRQFSRQRTTYLEWEHLPLLYQLDNSLGGTYKELLPERDAVFLHVSLQELLLNGPKLFDAFRRANKFLPNASGDYYLQYRIAEADGDTDEMSRREEKLARRADRRIRRSELHADTGGNHLGIRLLQLALWRSGFYTGMLDGDFGPVSHRAVLALVAQERDHGDWKDRKLDRVVVKATEAGSWLVDLKLVGRLLDAYAPPGEAEAEREENEIWDSLRASGREDVLDQRFAERQREVSMAYGQPEQHPFRRVYFGLRSLIRGAFRAVGRIVAWVAGAVETILGAVFDFVKALAKRLQEGIGLFFTGFRYFGHFLLGRPFVSLGNPVGQTHPVMITRYRIDFDVVNLVDAAVSDDDLLRHRAYIRRMTEGAVYFLDTTIAVIRLIATLQPPMGWLRLGVLVARCVRDLLRREGETVPVV